MIFVKAIEGVWRCSLLVLDVGLDLRVVDGETGNKHLLRSGTVRSIHGVFFFSRLSSLPNGCTGFILPGLLETAKAQGDIPCYKSLFFFVYHNVMNMTANK